MIGLLAVTLFLLSHITFNGGSSCTHCPPRRVVGPAPFPSAVRVFRRLHLTPREYGTQERFKAQPVSPIAPAPRHELRAGPTDRTAATELPARANRLLRTRVLGIGGGSGEAAYPIGRCRHHRQNLPCAVASTMMATMTSQASNVTITAPIYSQRDSNRIGR